MTAALYGIFFVSGLASLLFETLWFRQAGLVLGNTVWASSITSGSFMAGLALGNGRAARHGGRLRSPLRAYAALEAIIAASGVFLVLAFPFLGAVLAPVLRLFLDAPFVLNSARLGLAFTLLLVPATAMGATLPAPVAGTRRAAIPVSAASSGGSMAGTPWAASPERSRGDAFPSSSDWASAGRRSSRPLLNLLAAGVAAFAAGRRGRVCLPMQALATTGAIGPRLRVVDCSPPSLRRALLALEVVWFRFLLLLFVDGTSLTFAVDAGRRARSASRWAACWRAASAARLQHPESVACRPWPCSRERRPSWATPRFT